MNNNCQVINSFFDPTFHILKQNGQNYGEFLDLFIGSPLLANLAIDYKVLMCDLDSCQAVMFHSLIQICLLGKESPTQVDSELDNTKNKYLFDMADWNKFKTCLDNFNCIDFTHLSIEEKLKEITNKIVEATEQSISLASNDVRQKPALPKSILKCIKERHKLQSK